ncbi:hypothetical protein CBL_02181 [Carabus blaptoides fortunei]
MDPLLMSEVEQEISRILNKNKQRQQTQTEEYCNENNMVQCLENLTQEFDYFDVNRLDVSFDLTTRRCMTTVMVQLINSSYNLVHLHRALQQREDNLLQKNSRLSSDVKSLSKTVESLRNDLVLKETQLKISKEKLCLDKLANDELRSRISAAKKEMTLIQKENVTEKNRHKHEMQRVLTDSRRLENRFRKNCGEYVSNEKQITTVMDEYKKSEELYKDMIDKLQKTNHELLAEIVALKEHLVIATFDKN